MKDQQQRLIKQVRKYFKEKKKSEIKKDWEQFSKFDEVGIPIGELLEYLRYKHKQTKNTKK